MTTIEQQHPTRDEVRDLVRECGLDWHRGFMRLFPDDDTNRYEVLVRAASEQEAQPPSDLETVRRALVIAAFLPENGSRFPSELQAAALVLFGEKMMGAICAPAPRSGE